MDIATIEDVKLLVDTFYSKVMQDEIIGHFFTLVAPINMDSHMPIMYRFWGSMLLGNSDYQGNPMQKHFKMNEKVALEPHHFDRWLEVWKQTTDDLFQGPKADEAKMRAENIAHLMSYNMQKAKH